MSDILKLAKECGAEDLYDFSEKITDINCAVFKPYQLATFAARIRAEALEEAEEDSRMLDWADKNLHELQFIGLPHYTLRDVLRTAMNDSIRNSKGRE